MTTRVAFLDRVRREMAKTRGLFPASASSRPLDPVGEAGALRRQARADADRLLERFRTEAERVGTAVHRARSADEAAKIVLELAVARGARRVATWRRSGLTTLSHVAARLADAGLEVFDGAPESAAGAGASAPRERLAAAEMGITAADLAVAETGSVVLVSGVGKGRAVSLLPACHVVLLGAHQLVGTLEDAGVVLESWHAAEGGPEGANIVFITGPSRTADIELTLTRGVHGPREVHVLVVAGDEPL